MQIEANTLVHSKTSTFGPLALAEIDQSGMSYDPPPPFANGKESLAASSDAALLQERMVALICDLYLERMTTGTVDALLSDLIFPMYVDVSFLATQADAQESSTVARETARLLNELQAAFEADPLEDGMDHPAERIVERALRHTENQHVLDWLGTVSLDSAQPSFAASVLRCLGRIEHVGTASWCAQLVRNGLELDDVEIRDAAVQAAESWRDPDIVDVLAAHDEPEPWLRDYIRDVITDLRD